MNGRSMRCAALGDVVVAADSNNCASTGCKYARRLCSGLGGEGEVLCFASTVGVVEEGQKADNGTDHVLPATHCCMAAHSEVLLCWEILFVVCCALHCCAICSSRTDQVAQQPGRVRYCGVPVLVERLCGISVVLVLMCQ